MLLFKEMYAFKLCTHILYNCYYNYNIMAFDYDNEELEFSDPETNFGYNKDQGFSHQILVMMSYRKVIEALSMEMREGYNEKFTDDKGKVHIIYHSDTREVAFQSILTLKNTMIGDLEASPFLEKINDLIKQVGRAKKFWLKEQWRWWEGLSPQQKIKFEREGKYVAQGLFNKQLDFDNFYIDDKIEIFREVFEQLELCLKTNRYFARKAIVSGPQ